MDLKTFFTEVLRQYGIYTTVAVIIVLYVAKDLWSKLSARWFSENTRRPVALKDHPTFKEFDYIIEHMLVNDFKCDCPLRKALYRDILIERMKSFKKRLYEFVLTDLESKELYPTQQDFYIKIISILDTASNEANTTAIANGIPEFVIDNMENHRKQMRDVMNDMLKIICYSDYHYPNNTERMRAVLTFAIVFCKNYMDMLEGILASYNGDIKNLEYKGIICKDCKVCIHEEYKRKMKASLLGK